MDDIILAKTAGFCFGVDRAIKKLDQAIEEHAKPVFTIGPIIHNKNVMEYYENQGVHIADEIGALNQGSIAVIRSHGVGKQCYDELAKKDAVVIDATCPYVKKVQEIAHRYHSEGYQILIIGDSKHPEVIGVNGWCEHQAKIINSKKDVLNLQNCGRICVVAQTTIIEAIFQEIVNAVQERFPETIVFNTICSATEERQNEAAKIAKDVDKMIVIGDKKSSNTKRLAEICRLYNTNVYQIESAAELAETIFLENDRVGITAGASTPAWIIKEVAEKVWKSKQEFRSSTKKH